MGTKTFNIVAVIVEALFAAIGALVGGGWGAFLGVLAGGGLYWLIRHSWLDEREKRIRAESDVALLSTELDGETANWIKEKGDLGNESGRFRGALEVMYAGWCESAHPDWPDDLGLALHAAKWCDDYDGLSLGAAPLITFTEKVYNPECYTRNDLIDQSTVPTEYYNAVDQLRRSLTTFFNTAGERRRRSDKYRAWCDKELMPGNYDLVKLLTYLELPLARATSRGKKTSVTDDEFAALGRDWAKAME